jgi:O-antigen ligase
MTVSNNKIRVGLLSAVIFSIPLQEVYLFGNPYLFLPILSFIAYFLFSVFTAPVLFNIKRSQGFLIALFLLWILLIVLTFVNYETRYMPKAYSYLQRLLTQMIFFVMLVNEFKVYRTKVKTLFLAFIYSLIVVSICYYAGIGVEFRDGRLFIFDTNPNTLGIWFVIGIVMAFHLIFEHKIPLVQKILLVICIVIFTIVMATTGSRAVLVTLAAGLFLYSIFLIKSLSSILVYLVPATIFAAVLFNILLSNEVLQERLVTENERQDFGGRLPLWQATYDIVSKNPVFGVGPPGYEYEIVRRIGVYKVPHNEYFLILCYSGVTGFILFAVFLGKFLLSCIKIFRIRTASKGLPLSLLFVTTLYMASAGRIFTTFVVFFVFAIVMHFTTPSDRVKTYARSQRSLANRNENPLFN